MWDYAKLSKAAKSVGGPEKLVNTIFSKGVSNGRKSMAPWLLVAGAAGALIYKEIDKVVRYFNEKEEESNEELEKAKQELIDGINEYDEKNKNEEDEDKLEEDN